MDKQYVALVTHKDKGVDWKKGEVVLLDPELALPYLGTHLTPLYTAIKSGLFQTTEVEQPLIVKVVADVKEVLKPDPEPEKTTAPALDSNDTIKPEPSKKKLLQNKLQAQIQAKKAEMAKEK